MYLFRRPLKSDAFGENSRVSGKLLRAIVWRLAADLRYKWFHLFAVTPMIPGWLDGPVNYQKIPPVIFFFFTSTDTQANKNKAIFCTVLYIWIPVYESCLSSLSSLPWKRERRADNFELGWGGT